jgi:hypothetical protein
MLYNGLGGEEITPIILDGVMVTADIFALDSVTSVLACVITDSVYALVFSVSMIGIGTV